MMSGQQDDSNPMAQLTELQERLAQALEPLGVKVQQAFFTPGSPGPDVMQIVASIDRDVAFKTAEQRALDAQFREIALHEHLAAQEEKKENAIEGLKQLLRDDGGFLDHPEGGETPPASEDP